MPLIDSPRLSKRDRAVWDRLYGQDCRLAVSPLLDAKEERALDAIRAFAAAGPCTVSCSWGKDSVVVAHLVWRTGLDLALVHVLQPAVKKNQRNNPDSPAVRVAYLERFETVYHEWAPEKPVRDTLAAANRVFGQRHITGVRADESMARRQSARYHGVASQNSCRPILSWSSRDVFVYLAKYDLPTHPAYAMSLGGLLDRDRLRVHSIGDKRGDEFGRVDYERTYYPEVWHELDAAVTEH